MSARKRASFAAKVLVLIGVLPLMAGLFGGLAIATEGHLDYPVPVVVIGTVGLGFVSAAIALDRWACRQPDENSRGFEVVVADPAGSGADPIETRTH